MNRTAMSPELIALSHAQIREGSKSFALASLFFSKREKICAWLLYSWCRYCDDQIDQAQDAAVAVTRLRELEAKVHEAYVSPSPLPDASFEALRLLFRECGLPLQYPLDLLRGFQMDVEGYQGRSKEELLDYCYCVAGVVGLMMCHVMGVSDEKALGHAVHLGQAMQLTNISRDFDDDWRLGRVYVPGEWLIERDLRFSDFNEPHGRSHWAAFARELLKEADLKYHSGREGLDYLSLRAAWAVGIAAAIYRLIGIKVRSRAHHAWTKRCYTSRTEKAVVAVIETVKLLIRFSPRLFRKWEPIQIKSIWSHK